MQTGVILFSLAAAIIFSMWAGALAHERHRRAWPYMLLAVLMPLPGVLVAWAMSARPEPAAWRA